MERYHLVILLSIVLISLTGCIQFLPDDIPVSLGDDNESETNNGFGAEVEVNGFDVTLSSLGEADKVVVRSGDGEQTLAQGETVTVSEGDLIIEIKGEQEQLLTRVDGENNNNNNNDNNSNISTGGGTLGIESNSDWVVVGDGGHYTRIQRAIDQARPYTTIVVKDRTYNEEITIDEEINLIGLGTNLESNSGETAITIKNTKANVNGFDIKGYETGIKVHGNTKEFSIKNTYIKDVRTGIDIKNNHAKWEIENTRIESARVNGIRIEYDYGRFTLNGVLIHKASSSTPLKIRKVREGTLNNVRIENTDILRISSYQPLELNNMWLNDDLYSENIVFDKCNDPTCGGVIEKDSYSMERLNEEDVRQVETNRVHTTMGDFVRSTISRAEEGDLIVINGNANPFTVDKDVKIIGNNDEASVQGSSGDTCITIEGNSNVVLRNLDIIDCDLGVYAVGNSGDWKIINSQVESKFSAVLARKTTGNWLIKNSRIVNSKIGIAAVSSTGNWLIYNSTIGGHTSSGISADNSRGNPRVIYSELTDNKYDVSAETDGRFEATRNYWGEGSVIDPGSSVNVNNKCSDATCWDKRQSGPLYVDLID